MFGTGPFVFPQATVNAFRFREANDAVVPLSSQQGGIGTTMNFNNDIHFHVPCGPLIQCGITDDAAAATTAFTTLDGPVTGLTVGLPGEGSTGNGVSIPPVPGLGATTDAANYTAQCGAGGPMRLNRLDPFGKHPTSTQQPTSSQTQTMTQQARPATALTYNPNITVTSPTAGTSFVSGSTLTITVSVAPSITVVGYGVDVSGIGRLDGTNLTTGTGGSTFQASTTLTAVSVGPLTITPEVYDNNGNYILGTPITVVEVYTGVATLTSATLVDHNFQSLLPPATQQLYLTGTYSDGFQFDLSNSLMGTTWTSSNPSVLTVDPNGNVTLVGTGVAVVTVQNGGFTDWATFLVENPATPLAPINFTSQVTIQPSGLILNRNTGFFVQTITLTNTSSIPLVGPLYLVVSGIPTGVALIGINGVTANIAPVGSDFFTLPLAGAGLTMLPGQVVKLQFQWLNPNRVPLTDSLAVMRTSVTP
jgi:hypothetical protein